MKIRDSAQGFFAHQRHEYTHSCECEIAARRRKVYKSEIRIVLFAGRS